jgi:hypothetical protein
MRAVIDHHVDRLDVDAQQCVKLTSTNRSIGLISHIACSDKQTDKVSHAKQPAHLAASSTRASLDLNHARYRSSIRSGEGPSIVQTFFLNDLVVIARGNTPDPIPNSAVKTLSADGTPS